VATVRRAIERTARRDGYVPPASLIFFDDAIRERIQWEAVNGAPDTLGDILDEILRRAGGADEEHPGWRFQHQVSIRVFRSASIPAGRPPRRWSDAARRLGPEPK
jgi:hypothetical protein